MKGLNRCHGGPDGKFYEQILGAQVVSVLSGSVQN